MPINILLYFILEASLVPLCTIWWGTNITLSRVSTCNLESTNSVRIKVWLEFYLKWYLGIIFKVCLEILVEIQFGSSIESLKFVLNFKRSRYGPWRNFWCFSVSWRLASCSSGASNSSQQAAAHLVLEWPIYLAQACFIFWLIFNTLFHL